jgi:uncharacterized membrane protein
MTDFSDRNLVIYAAGYDEAGLADADYEALKDLRDVGVFVVAAVILDRDAEGKVRVRDKEHIVGGGAVAGGAVGLVVGLFAPPLLAATAIGAGIGAAVGGLVKHHREGELASVLEEAMPVNTSAIVVLLDDAYADQVDKVLAKAARKATREVDAADAASLAQALESADDKEIIAQVNTASA